MPKPRRPSRRSPAPSTVTAPSELRVELHIRDRHEPSAFWAACYGGHRGGALPDGLADWRPGAPTPVPVGSILCYLDPPAEAPQEFVAKAARYGWPVDADLTPVWLTIGPHGPADLDCTAVQRLTLAIAAVLAHDRQPGGGPATATCTLAAGQQARYTLHPPH